MAMDRAHATAIRRKPHPHLRCTVFDLPAVVEIAARNIAMRGLSERVTTVAGDFFADPLPRADVITMGMILHDWKPGAEEAAGIRGL
jgi:hypothetical protein